MVGESLEQHCEIEFNKLRMTGFANAYFEKDNDARTGSKGDYIYREADEDGTRAPAARATIFTAKRTRTERSLFPSCLR